MAATWPAVLGSAVALVLFAALIVPVLVTGAGLPQLVALIPALSGGMAAALGVFAGAMAAVLLVIFLIASVIFGSQMRRA